MTNREKLLRARELVLTVSQDRCRGEVTGRLFEALRHLDLAINHLPKDPHKPPRLLTSKEVDEEVSRMYRWHLTKQDLGPEVLYYKQMISRRTGNPLTLPHHITEQEYNDLLTEGEQSI